MSPDSDPVARWPVLAAEAREIADQMTDPEAKLIMLSIAQGYEHLAQRALERSTKKESLRLTNEIASACADVIQGGVGTAP
jgi:hypothetical protein